MVKISSKASSPAWQRAMAKAIEAFNAGVRAKHLCGRRYDVPSATSSALDVVDVVNPGAVTATCSCPHGQRAGQDAHCYHAALAICRRSSG